MTKYILISLAILHFSSNAAAFSCGSEPLSGCMETFRELEDEQNKVDREGADFDLKKSLKSLFSSVNGKTLEYIHPIAGKYTLKFEMKSDRMDITYNDRPATDTQICYKLCPSTSKIQWSSPENGVFQKISGGLKIGRYNFKVSK